VSLSNDNHLILQNSRGTDSNAQNS